MKAAWHEVLRCALAREDQNPLAASIDVRLGEIAPVGLERERPRHDAAAALTTTPIVDLVAAFGHTGALSEGAREMCAKSVPDLRVVSFSELLLTTFMGMAGRLCTTMRIARKCSISLSVVADVRPSAGQIMPQPIRVA